MRPETGDERSEIPGPSLKSPVSRLAPDSRQLVRAIVWARKNRRWSGGLLIVAGVMLCAVLAPVLAPYSPIEQVWAEGLKGPSLTHPFGYDRLGRDLFSRTLYGARISFWVAAVAVSISLGIGLLVGAVAGYFGGWTDELLMRLVDILQAFPGILLAITFAAILGPSITNVVVALSLIGWVGYARLTRGQILVVREMEFVTAARALGGKDLRVMFRHLLPNILGPILVEASFGFATVIVAEASLSFLGLGTQPPTPSWGAMLNEARQYFLVAPHLTLFPGLAIVVTVMGFNFLGDSLRDLWDPKSGQ
jgi:peptide/nickel transport system permease protein